MLLYIDRGFFSLIKFYWFYIGLIFRNKFISANYVFEFLINTQTDANISVAVKRVFKRRFIVLIKQWVKELQIKKSELLVLLLQQVSNEEDIAIKFTVIECLTEIIKTDYEIELDYNTILCNCIKIVVDLLEKLSNPNLIWQISFFIGNLLDKCKSSPNLSEFNKLNELELEKIITNNPNLMTSVFSEIFRKILVTSPNPSFIFPLCFRYLTFSFNSLNMDNIEIVLKFWLTLLRETDEARSKEDQMIISELFKIFESKFEYLWGFSDKEEVFSRLLIILEETLMAGFEFKGLNDFLNTIYDKTNQEDMFLTFRMKNDFYSVLTSFFLLRQMQNRIDEIDIESCLKMIFHDMNIECNKKAMKNEIMMKNQITALFDRIVLLDIKFVLSFVQNNNISEDKLLSILKVNIHIINFIKFNFDFLS